MLPRIAGLFSQVLWCILGSFAANCVTVSTGTAMYFWKFAVNSETVFTGPVVSFEDENSILLVKHGEKSKIPLFNHQACQLRERKKEENR